MYWKNVGKLAAVVVVVVTMLWASWQMGKMHAITASYIYQENGYYVIELDGEEWLHFAPDAPITSTNNGWK